MTKITVLTVNRFKFIRAVSQAMAWMVEPTDMNRVAFRNTVRESYTLHPEAKHFSDPLFAALFAALDNNSKVIVKDWLMFSTHNPSMVTVAKFFYRDDPKNVSFGIVNCTFTDMCNAPTLAEWVQLK